MINWQAHNIANIPSGYQVAVADINWVAKLTSWG